MPVRIDQQLSLLLRNILLRLRVVREECGERDAPEERQHPVDVEDHLPAEVVHDPTGREDGDYGAQGRTRIDYTHPHALLLVDDPFADEDVDDRQVRSAHEAGEEAQEVESDQLVGSDGDEYREQGVTEDAD